MSDSGDDIKRWERVTVLDYLNSGAAGYILRHLRHYFGNFMVLDNFLHRRATDCIKGLAEINEIQVQGRMPFEGQYRIPRKCR